MLHAVRVSCPAAEVHVLCSKADSVQLIYTLANLSPICRYNVIIADGLVGSSPNFNGMLPTIAGRHDNPWFLSRGFVLAALLLVVVGPMLVRVAVRLAGRRQFVGRVRMIACDMAHMVMAKPALLRLVVLDQQAFALGVRKVRPERAQRFARAPFGKLVEARHGKAAKPRAEG